jgi:uncharacterized membrane protein YedE/YeeE
MAVSRILVALLAGTLFGAGLAWSGLADPSRVQGFLDVLGRWDPTLAFVMAGAILPMALAWLAQKRLAKPFADAKFELPGTTKIDARLAFGAVLFGVGWGIAGLCPGPAVAGLAIQPGSAVLFVIAMLSGMFLERMWANWTQAATKASLP